MLYLLVQPQAGLTSQQRADAINKELFNVSRPLSVRNENDVTNKVFGELTNGELTALCIPDTGYIITVHPDNDLTNLIALFPNLSPAEKDGLAGYIASQSSFPFGNIIPSDAQIVDEQYLLDNRFFDE